MLARSRCPNKSLPSLPRPTSKLGIGNSDLQLAIRIPEGCHIPCGDRPEPQCQRPHPPWQTPEGHQPEPPCQQPQQPGNHHDLASRMAAHNTAGKITKQQAEAYVRHGLLHTPCHLQQPLAVTYFAKPSKPNGLPPPCIRVRPVAVREQDCPLHSRYQCRPPPSGHCLATSTCAKKTSPTPITERSCPSSQAQPLLGQLPRVREGLSAAATI